MLVTAIAIVSAVVLAQNDDAGDEPAPHRRDGAAVRLEVRVSGRRAVTSGMLVLPVDQPVELTLRALDVIHSFWVPEIGQKQDAVPGIETTLVITPNAARRRTRSSAPSSAGSATRSCARRCDVVAQARVRDVPRGSAAAGGAGDDDAGEAVFTTAGCGGCHAFEPAGADGEGRARPRKLAAAAEAAGSRSRSSSASRSSTRTRTSRRATSRT